MLESKIDQGDVLYESNIKSMLSIQWLYYGFRQS